MKKFDISELKKPKKQGLLKEDDKKRGSLKKIGRPTKTDEERLTKKATVNFTKNEYEKLLEESAKRYNISLSMLIRLLLKENNCI